MKFTVIRRPSEEIYLSVEVNYQYYKKINKSLHANAYIIQACFQFLVKQTDFKWLTLSVSREFSQKLKS